MDMGGEWVEKVEKSGRVLLRDEDGLDQGISCGGGEGSRYFQDIFLKVESTEFADELDVLCKTKGQRQESSTGREIFLFYSVSHLGHLDSVWYSINIP